MGKGAVPRVRRRLSMRPELAVADTSGLLSDLLGDAFAVAFRNQAVTLPPWASTSSNKLASCRKRSLSTSGAWPTASRPRRRSLNRFSVQPNESNANTTPAHAPAVPTDLPVPAQRQDCNPPGAPIRAFEQATG
jgi:hypothetical protein